MNRQEELEALAKDMEEQASFHHTWSGGVSKYLQSCAARLRAILSRAESSPLPQRIRDITHPYEAECGVCGHVFDGHVAGCPYEAIDAALAALDAAGGGK